MKNLISSGQTVPAIAPAGGVVSGAPVLMGAMFGVPATTAAAGAAFELHTLGIYELAKAAGSAISFGAQLYWDDTNKVVTTSASGNTACGKCAKAALSAATICRVNINR